MTGDEWWTATAYALLFIFIYHLGSIFSYRNRHPQRMPPFSPVPPTQISVSELVSDEDLKLLIQNLDSHSPSPIEKWEKVIHRSTPLVSYSASCSKPKEGPLKYLSTTVFENCSPERLRDFYMDNSYRKQWDKTVTDHVQLQLDTSYGTEVGRTMKKFPLLTAREYVLAWRLWEGSDSTFYCFTKECNHPLAPQQKKYVRVRYFRSGWRIRNGKYLDFCISFSTFSPDDNVRIPEYSMLPVPGKNASEIKMFHQEDAGLNVEMAKLAFAKGIWSYVLRMERALRAYSASSCLQTHTSASSITLIQKVPPGLDRLDGVDFMSTCPAPTIHGQSGGKQKLRRPSRRALANSFLIVGGLICLSKRQSALGAKVVVAYFLAKLHKRNNSSGQSRSA